MKKFIDSEGFKSFLEWLNPKITELHKHNQLFNIRTDTSFGAAFETNIFDDIFGIIGTRPSPEDPNVHLLSDELREFTSKRNISACLAEIYKALGQTNAQAGTDTAFARIKKLETTATTADDLAQTTDMDYLFDLYVNHDASTISTEDKNAIITTVYAGAGKPDYLD